MARGNQGSPPWSTTNPTIPLEQQRSIRRLEQNLSASQNTIATQAAQMQELLSQFEESKDQLKEATYLALAATNQTLTVSGAYPLILSVPGTLGILSNAAPEASYQNDTRIIQIAAYLKKPPIAGFLTAQVKVAGQLFQQVSLTGTETIISTSSSNVIRKNDIVRLDITQVGLAFPGSDLTVILRS